MATDPVLAERMPASQPVHRRGAGAMPSHRHSDQAGRPYMYDIAGLEASTRQTGASNDSSPSSPFPRGTKVKTDSFGSAAVYRHRQTNNAENRKIAIVPPSLKATQGPGKGDESAQHLPSVHSAIQPTLPLPLAGCRQELVVDAQLAASAGSGSALVAPPDTDTNQVSLQDIYSYSSSLTPSSPSSSASLSPTTPKPPHSPSSSEPEKPRAARSRGHSKTPSRDVGIVGTLTRRESPQDQTTVQDAPSDYRPPIFQTPSSRSSSLDTTTSAHSTTSLESTPFAQAASSGEAHVRPTAMSASVEPVHNAHVMNGHGIHAQPLPLDTSLPHAQLVSNLEQSRASPTPTTATTVSTAPSSYLYYQPGVHSKAGPLPPPPRAMFDIDFTAPPPPRPPRRCSPSPLTSPIAPGVEAPASVTVRLASKPSTASIHQIHISATPISTQLSSSEDSDYSSGSKQGPTSPIHQREGAFPPSKILVTPAERQQSLPDKSIRLVPEVPAKDELPKSPADILDEAPAITVQPVKDEPAPSTARPVELRRETSWMSTSNDSSHVSSEGGRRAFEDARPLVLDNRSSSSIRESAPEDSPTEPKRKLGILTNLKRYSSLPRPPSVKSPKASAFTRTPSPPPPSPPKPRIRARSPDPMRFKDITNKKSALERATAYANKINELSMYDCGLSDWITTTKERGVSKTRLVHTTPSQSLDDVLDPQPRNHRSSISSEMTFPLRSADAYIATDLSQRDIDTVPSPNVPPPALPYPALAGVPPANTAIGGAQLSHSPSLSVGAKVTAGLLSSLGRNATTKKDTNKPAEKVTRSATRTTKQSLTSLPNPRPVQITSAPSVPGGPRALPGRVQRSQTLMLSSSPPSSGNNPSAASLPMRRRSNTLKRPSFFGRAPGPSPELDMPTNTEFTRQVERLADLLPHADKGVLAGYLNRAGQDILAIGQYLEDEKNGNVRRH